MIFESFYASLNKQIRFESIPETFSSSREIAGIADYMITIGGDGTLLDAISLVRDSAIPILGINLGRLGFLTSAGKEDIAEVVEALEQGHFVLDSRTLLHLESNKPLFGEDKYALNEFTIHKKDSSAMISIHTFLNGEYLATYWADGLIVSTPTGSTAYSLSCGGPIIFPASENFLITPVAPHNLNIRPIIVSDNTVISFEIEGRSENFLCSLDSRYETIDSTFQLAVRKENFMISLVRLNDNNFLSTLHKKMMWGRDNRN